MRVLGVVVAAVPADSTPCQMKYKGLLENKRRRDFEMNPQNAAFFCMTLAAVCYMPLARHAWSREWVYDDSVAVKGNPLVVDAQSSTLVDVWTSDFWGRLPVSSPRSHKSYRPLTTLTYRLEWSRRGDNPVGFLSTNVVLHVLATLLCIPVALALQRYHLFDCPLRRGGGAYPGAPAEDLNPLNRQRFVAAATALLFATHPVHSEAVSNVTGRAEVLMALCFIAGFLAHVASSERQLPCSSGRGYSPVWLDMVRCLMTGSFATAAMLCKESGVMLPVVCAAWELARYHVHCPPAKALISLDAGAGSKQKCEAEVAAGDGLGSSLSAIIPRSSGRVHQVSRGAVATGENSPVRLALRGMLLVTLALGLAKWRVGLNQSPAPNFFFNANRVAFMATPSASSGGSATARVWLRRLNVANLWLEHLLVLCVPAHLSVDWGADSVPLVESLLSPQALLILSAMTCAVVVSIATAADVGLAFFTSVNKSRKQVGRALAVVPAASAASSPSMASSLTPPLVGIWFAVLRPELRHGLALMVLSFLPCGNIYTFVGATKAERWLYLPSVGFCFLAAVAAADGTGLLFAVAHRGGGLTSSDARRRGRPMRCPFFIFDGTEPRSGTRGGRRLGSWS